HYATNGIKIFKETYYGYIPTDAHKSFLPIKVRNVPLDSKEHISNQVKETFQDFGKIASIKPLLIEGTPYLTDQWIVIFDSTDDLELEKRIPRFIYIEDNRVTTEWKEAPKVCYFCDQTGHIKKNCSQFQEAKKLRQHFQELKNKKKNLIETLDKVITENQMDTDKEQTTAQELIENNIAETVLNQEQTKEPEENSIVDDMDA